MTHFGVLVLVEPRHEHRINERAAELLAPYDETLAVTPYEECLDDQSYQSMAKHYHLNADDLPALAAKMENWMHKPGYVKGNAVCWQETYNRQSKWDYWDVVDCWPAWLGGAEDGSTPNAQRVYDLPPPPLVTHDNSIGAILAELTGNPPLELPPAEHHHACPYALVTPDGEWHSQGQMGWFAMSDDAMSDLEWSRRYFEILSGHSKHFALLVDCHI